MAKKNRLLADVPLATGISEQFQFIINAQEPAGKHGPFI